MELAATREGKVLGLRAHYVQDCGSYLQLLTPPIAHLTLFMAPGAYDIQPDRHQGHQGVHQHPADGRLSRRRPARGHARDRADDGHAGGGGRESAATEVRRRNFLTEFPYASSDRARSTTRAIIQRRSTAGGAARRPGATFEATQAGGRGARQAAGPRRLDLGGDLRPGALGRSPTRSGSPPADGRARPCGCTPPARSR